MIDALPEDLEDFIVCSFLLHLLLLTLIGNGEVEVHIIVVDLHDMLPSVLVDSLLINRDQLFIASDLTVVELRDHFDQLGLAECAIVLEQPL